MRILEEDVEKSKRRVEQMEGETGPGGSLTELAMGLTTA